MLLNIEEKLFMIIWGIIGAAGAIGLFLSKRKKPLQPPESTPTEPTIEPATPKPIPPEEKGRKCNVCETNIPEGLNVCPSCGDTYS